VPQMTPETAIVNPTLRHLMSFRRGAATVTQIKSVYVMFMGGSNSLQHRP
jgi:hypothetical protein